jgi:hypothetical protein
LRRMLARREGAARGRQVRDRGGLHDARPERPRPSSPFRTTPGRRLRSSLRARPRNSENDNKA